MLISKLVKKSKHECIIRQIDIQAAHNKSIATSGADGRTIGCSSLSETVLADE